MNTFEQIWNIYKELNNPFFDSVPKDVEEKLKTAAKYFYDKGGDDIVCDADELYIEATKKIGW